jgi:hypothetical protein
MISIIALVWCLALYFPMNLPLGGSAFLPCAPGLLLAFLHLPRRPNLGLVGAVVLLSLLFVLADCIFAVSFLTAFERRLLSGGQLPYTLFNCMVIAFCRPFSPGERQGLVKVLLAFLLAMTAVAVLEPFTPIGRVSDAFRQAVYPTELLYDATERDIAIAGRIRPKAFCSEPSSAAWALFCIGAIIFGMTRDRRTRVIVMVTILVSAVAFASPSNVIGSLVLLACYLIQAGKVSIQTIVLRSIAGVALGFPMYLVANTVFGNRFEMSTLIEDGSTFVRVIQPFSMAWEALLHDPLFGVGFGGIEEIWNKIEVVEGGDYAARLNMTAGAALLTIPLFAGVAGCIAFAFFLRFLTVQFAKETRMTFLLITLFVMSQKASIVNTMAWYVMAGWLVGRGSQESAANRRPERAPAGTVGGITRPSLRPADAA